MSKLTPAQGQIILNLAKHCFTHMYTDVDILFNAADLQFVTAKQVHKELFPEKSITNIDLIETVVDLYNIYLQENYALNVENQFEDCHNNLRQLHENLRNLEIDFKRSSEQEFNPSNYMRLFVLIKRYTDHLTVELTTNIDLPLLQILDTLTSIRRHINRAIDYGLSNHDCIYFITLRDCNEFIVTNYLKLHMARLKQATAADVMHLQEFSNLIAVYTQALLPQSEAYIINRLNLMSETKLLFALSSCVELTIAVNQATILLDSRYIQITAVAKNLGEMLDENVRQQINFDNFFNDLANKLAPKLRDSGQILEPNLLMLKINALAFWKKYLSGGNLQRVLRIKLHAEQEYINHLTTKELLEYYEFVTENTIGVEIVTCADAAQKDQNRAIIRAHMQKLYEVICERLDLISPGWDIRRKTSLSVIKIYPTI